MHTLLFDFPRPPRGGNNPSFFCVGTLYYVSVRSGRAGPGRQAERQRKTHKRKNSTNPPNRSVGEIIPTTRQDDTYHSRVRECMMCNNREGPINHHHHHLLSSSIGARPACRVTPQNPSQHDTHARDHRKIFLYLHYPPLAGPGPGM